MNGIEKPDDIVTKVAHLTLGSLSLSLFCSGVIWILSKSELLQRGVKTGRQHPLSLKIFTILSNPINLNCGISWLNRDHNILPSIVIRFPLSTEARVKLPFSVYILLYPYELAISVQDRFLRMITS